MSYASRVTDEVISSALQGGRMITDQSFSKAQERARNQHEQRVSRDSIKSGRSSRGQTFQNAGNQILNRSLTNQPVTNERQSISRTSSINSHQPNIPMIMPQSSDRHRPKPTQIENHNPRKYVPSKLPKSQQQHNTSYMSHQSNISQQQEQINLYERLQQSRFEIEQKMLQNQAQMQQQLLALETQRRNVAHGVVKAAITIQRHVRGFTTRIKLDKVKKLTDDFERARLNEMLGNLQQTVKNMNRKQIDEEASVHSVESKESIHQVPSEAEEKIEQASLQAEERQQRRRRQEITFEDVEHAITLIQRQSRVFLACRRFRQCLYRLILLKNILESKIHKEKVQVLFAFEQLIINTEEEDDSEIIKIRDQIENEDDPYLKQELIQLYQQPLKDIGYEPELVSDGHGPDQYTDVINEEDWEESVQQSVQKTVKKLDESSERVAAETPTEIRETKLAIKKASDAIQKVQPALNKKNAVAMSLTKLPISVPKDQSKNVDQKPFVLPKSQPVSKPLPTAMPRPQTPDKPIAIESLKPVKQQTVTTQPVTSTKPLPVAASKIPPVVPKPQNKPPQPLPKPKPLSLQPIEPKSQKNLPKIDQVDFKPQQSTKHLSIQDQQAGQSEPPKLRQSSQTLRKSLPEIPKFIRPPIALKMEEPVKINRPVNQERIVDLSKPKSYLDDPDVKPESKPRKEPKLSSKQLQQRAKRVMKRQEQAMLQIKQNAPILGQPLAIEAAPRVQTKIDVRKKLQQPQNQNLTRAKPKQSLQSFDDQIKGFTMASIVKVQTDQLSEESDEFVGTTDMKIGLDSQRTTEIKYVQEKPFTEPDEYSDDDMPFSKKRQAKPQPQAEVPVQAVVQRKEEPWFADPVSLYMRGMAQRREQMRQLVQK